MNRSKTKPDIVDKYGFPYWLDRSNELEYFCHWTLFNGSKKPRVVAHIEMLWDEDSTHIELSDIYIHDNYRQRGIGSQLIQQIKVFTKEQKMEGIIGEVNATSGEGDKWSLDQTSLFEWYRKQGFSVNEDSNQIRLDIE